MCALMVGPVVALRCPALEGQALPDYNAVRKQRGVSPSGERAHEGEEERGRGLLPRFAFTLF
jgi:hypothetical protein